MCASGGHVRSTDTSAAGIQLGQAEIEDLGVAQFGDKYVCRLNVAMDDALGVGGLEGFRDVDSPVQYGIERKRLAIDAMPQGCAIQKLHDDESPPVHLVNFVDGTDVWMVER